jgi:hypothetical protein
MDAPGALAAGRWGEARRGFAQSIEEGETADAYLGHANALWWLGENEPSVAACTRAYALHRRAGDVAGMGGTSCTPMAPPLVSSTSPSPAISSPA